MKPADLAAYIFLALLWGFSFLLVLQVVAAFGWVGAVCFRCFIASGVLVGVARISGRRLVFGRSLPHIIVVGATTVAGQLVGLSFATPRIGTAMAAIIVASIPLQSMLLGQLFGHEPLRRGAVAGLVLGFAGIVFLVGFPAVPVTADFVLGCLAAFFGTSCAAFGSVYAGRRLRSTGPWEITIGAFFAGGVMTLPLLPLVPLPRVPGWVDYGLLVMLAAVMSSLTYVIYFRLVARLGATQTISVEFVVTVVAVLVGAGLLHEPLSWPQWLGAGIIVGGCCLVLGLVPPPLRRLLN